MEFIFQDLKTHHKSYKLLGHNVSWLITPVFAPFGKSYTWVVCTQDGPPPRTFTVVFLLNEWTQKNNGNFPFPSFVLNVLVFRVHHGRVIESETWETMN